MDKLIELPWRHWREMRGGGEKTGKGKVVRVGDAWYGIVQYFILQ